MKYVCILISLVLFAGSATILHGQVLVAYYSFDDGDAAESRGTQEFDGFVSGNPRQVCGVSGNALQFDGSGDFLTFAGPINDRFERADFLVSFYFHATGVSPRQTLLRKQADCETDDPRLVIDYLPGENAVEVVFAEDQNRLLGGETERIPLPEDQCWYHIAVERRDRELRVYINGERVKRLTSTSRFNISNNFNLEIARAACPTTSSNFQGFIDELNIFSGSLTLEEVEELYTAPDRIAEVAFPVVDAGEEVTLTVERTCANSFEWTPTESIVAGLNTFSPTVAPSESTVYNVEMGYPSSGCRSRDSVLIQVFNSTDFDCTQLFLPTAFTPNANGPQQNNTFGISNAATLQTFTSFEIYDRWGNRVFVTADADGEWDGTYEGEPAMPGMYLWRVAFGCGTEEFNKAGSVKLIR